ncbi:MAG: hypothetical protein R2855_10050 [Thermomicrobiales bacterium]
MSMAVSANLIDWCEIRLETGIDCRSSCSRQVDHARSARGRFLHGESTRQAPRMGAAHLDREEVGLDIDAAGVSLIGSDPQAQRDDTVMM